MTLADTLLERGSFVFPTFDYQKNIPETIKSKPWSHYLKKDNQGEIADFYYLSSARTGSALCPHKNDIERVLIFDVSLNIPDYEDTWQEFSGGEDMREDYGVVLTPNKSFHFWAKIPASMEGKKIPQAFDLGGGIRGEIRSSQSDLGFIMLPGSRSMSETGGIGEYAELQGVNLDALGTAPEGLMRRIFSRLSAKSKHSERPQADVERHVMALAQKFDPNMESEDGYEMARSLCFLMGMSSPAKPISEGAEQELWEAFSSKCDGIDPKKFIASIGAGWKDGRKAVRIVENTEEPTAGEILAETTSVFGAIPYLIEKKDHLGHTKETLIGIGASVSRRHAARGILPIKKMADLLPILASMTGVAHDTVFASPLYRKPNWIKGLNFYITSQKTVEYMGVPPTAMFWEIVDSWAKEAAKKGWFTETLKGRKETVGNNHFIYWPPDNSPSLVIPPTRYESFVVNIGSISDCEALVRENFFRKQMIGHNKKDGDSCFMPLSRLPPDTLGIVGDAYSEFIKHRMQDN